MNDELILVDIYDRPVGTGEKLWVHRSDRLHRAFSVFIIHGDRMLLQRRHPEKYHSGGLWANACCSHPRAGEELPEAVSRRLREELGVSAEARELFSFVYRCAYDSGLTEYEYDHVFLADYDGALDVDPREISETRWVDLGELEESLREHPEQYAAWFLIAAPRVLRMLRDTSC